MSEELADVRDAMNQLRDALNRSGEDIDVRFERMTITTLSDKHPRFSYHVSARKITHIDL